MLFTSLYIIHVYKFSYCFYLNGVKVLLEVLIRSILILTYIECFDFVSPITFLFLTNIQLYKHFGRSSPSYLYTL